MTVVSQAPRISIVMTARERHGLSLRSIDSIFANTSLPFRLIYLDVQSPPALRAALRAMADDGRIELHSYDEPLWPQAARQRVAQGLTGDYVVFIDNDVAVGSGWLEAMVRCADETQAGIVAPLYLWSDGIAKPRIHMAGGRIVEHRESSGRVLDESHHLLNADPETEFASMRRRPCDFAEFHCMLVRRDLLGDGQLLDPAIRCVHEHIDIALAVRERGATVWFEPAAIVTYLAFAPFTLDDLPTLRARWDAFEGEASIAAFARKWGVIDDERSFGGVRMFLARHVARVDPIRQEARDRDVQREPMQAHELAQTRSALLDLAQQHGYGDGDLRTLSDACARAQLLMNAGYRPCGRPFLNHLIGTASVLVRYGFRVEVAAAGVLHAAYTHCPPFNAGPQAAIAQVEALLGGRDHRVERLVHDYTLRDISPESFELPDPGAMTTHEADLLMLIAANEVDMHLSGEIRYSGRTDALAPALLDRITAVAPRLGASGLAHTLHRSRSHPQPVDLAWQTGGRVSYRIGGGTPAPSSMISPLPRLLAERARGERSPG